MAEPCAGSTFLSRGIENWFGEEEPNLPVVGIDRAPAHLTSLLIHIPTLAHRTGWAVLFCRVVDLGWRLGRVYFLAFLNHSRGQPDPALTARLASPATVDEPTTELD